MVLSIARQSVILKCLRKKSVMVGNYEFYYAAGLLNKLYNMELEGGIQPLEMSEKILGKIDQIESGDENEGYLIKMVSIYEPTDDYDDQMLSLFNWGNTELDMWQVTTDREE